MELSSDDKNKYHDDEIAMADKMELEIDYTSYSSIIEDDDELTTNTEEGKLFTYPKLIL
jgi:hypothetical protein